MHREQSDPLRNMKRFGYDVRRFLKPGADSKNDKPIRHIALLVICIDGLPYENIWRKWIENKNCNDAATTHVSLVCHAKYPEKVTSPWLRRRLLTYPPQRGRGNAYAAPTILTHCPEWGSIQITRAMIDLLAYAVQIQTPSDVDMRSKDERFYSGRFYGTDNLPSTPPPPVDQFLFLSETCLPVATLDEFVQQLNPHQSWVNARNRSTPGTPRNKYELDQFTGIHRMIPAQFRWKADQWHTLCRPHALAVLEIDRDMHASDRLWHSFTKINASDEMYFPTVLALRHILNEDKANTEIQIRPVTFTDWSEGMKNPSSYSNGIRDFARIAERSRQQGSLMARKFVCENDSAANGMITEEEWEAEMVRLCQDFPIQKIVAKADENTEDTELDDTIKTKQPNDSAGETKQNTEESDI